MLTELADARKVIGLKQTKKALRDGCAKRVYLSMNADIRLRETIVSLCDEMNVSIVEVSSMEELGNACGIQVGAAVAAIVS
mgnify:CR=1 FL=1